MYIYTTWKLRVVASLVTVVSNSQVPEAVPWKWARPSPPSCVRSAADASWTARAKLRAEIDSAAGATAGCRSKSLAIQVKVCQPKTVWLNLGVCCRNWECVLIAILGLRECTETRTIVHVHHPPFTQWESWGEVPHLSWNNWPITGIIHFCQWHNNYSVSVASLATWHAVQRPVTKPSYKSHKLMGVFRAHTGAIGC